MPKGIVGRAVCKLDSCERVAHGAGYCTSHYKRWVRHGDPLAGRVAGNPIRTVGGYIVVHRPGHPLAMPTGKVLVHRMVLYEKIGPGEHPCHWCGRLLRWDAHRRAPNALTTDHLDNSRDNNDPANLVPSCHPCNSGRLDHTPQAEAAKRLGAGRQAARTHCVNGHPWVEANIYRRPSNGTVICRVCTYERNKARRLGLTDAPLHRPTP